MKVYEVINKLMRFPAGNELYLQPAAEMIDCISKEFHCDSEELRDLLEQAMVACITPYPDDPKGNITLMCVELP